MIVAIAILFTYLIAFVFAGHGAGPMVIFLIAGLFAIGRVDFSWGIVGIIVGWIGIIGLISATFRFRSKPLKQIAYQFVWCVVLYLSWLGLALIGTEPGHDHVPLYGSFLLSAPFQITFLGVAGWLAVQWLMSDTDSDEKIL